jgi:AefR-like transcriptional repressor, C-terminal domain
MPEIGRKFYETGPAEGVAKVRHYLESQVVAGNLMIEDCEVAAAQFLDSCLATILKPLLFNAGDAPADERINWSALRSARSWRPTGAAPDPIRWPRICFRATMSSGRRSRRLAAPN